MLGMHVGARVKARADHRPARARLGSAPVTAPATTSEDGVRAGVRASRPYLLPTLALGVSFGILARDAGWGVVAPVVASLVVFSGSAQFALVAVLAAGGGALAAVGAAALVNARFAPLGLALGPALRGGRVRRALEAQANVDASWVLAHRGDGTFDRGGCSAPRSCSSPRGSRAPPSASRRPASWATPTASASTWWPPPSSSPSWRGSPRDTGAPPGGDPGRGRRRGARAGRAGLPILAAACVALLGLRRR